MVTHSRIPHRMIQSTNKDIPFTVAAQWQKPYIAAVSTVEQQVLPFKIRAHLPIG